ncbi:hypothetical protein HFN89_06095 [Rhizobium laguerreae]|nr:hypothetical protein [Rhizobium laguerreae]
MRNTSPSEYLAEIKNKLGLVRHMAATDDGYDQAADLRKTFPYLAHYTSGQTMFPARVKSGDGYGIESFIRFLASQCDGAIARDNRGFDQGDAPEGHRLAAKLGSAARLALTSSEREWAIERSKKYREQLTSRYGVAYQAVMEELNFVFPPAPDEQDRFVQHLRYNEASRSISFSLPSLADARAQSALMSEVWALVRTANVSLAPPLSDIAAKLRRNWDKNRTAMTFLQTERCARDLVDILEKLGYTKDERINAALDCNATAYIRVRPETGPGYRGKHLVGFLYHIARNDALRSEIIDLFDRFGRQDVRAIDAVNLSKKLRHPVQRFFIGEAVIDELEEILMRHGVQNYGIARMALDDSKRRAFQYPALSQAYVQTRVASLAAFRGT